MTLNQIFNLIGLLLITFGGISAARSSPAPQYNSDGSVSLASGDKDERIAIHHRQKHFRLYLSLVGIGAAFQAIAIFL